MREFYDHLFKFHCNIVVIYINNIIILFARLSNCEGDLTRFSKYQLKIEVIHYHMYRVFANILYKELIQNISIL